MMSCEMKCKHHYQLATPLGSLRFCCVCHSAACMKLFPGRGLFRLAPLDEWSLKMRTHGSFRPFHNSLGVLVLLMWSAWNHPSNRDTFWSCKSNIAVLKMRKEGLRTSVFQLQNTELLSSATRGLVLVRHDSTLRNFWSKLSVCWWFPLYDR